MVAGFVDAIRAGRPVPISGEDGLRALEVVVAGYRSSEVGRPVTISDINA
jgi:predicted dehydrogenase